MNQLNDPQSFILDAYAVKAVQKGEATPDQQIRFWNWLVYDACGYNRSTQRSDALETSFQNGKREVALEFNQMVAFDIEAFKANLSTPQKEFVAARKPRRSQSV